MPVSHMSILEFKPQSHEEGGGGEQKEEKRYRDTEKKAM
jgi:hypothetical protein